MGDKPIAHRLCPTRAIPLLLKKIMQRKSCSKPCSPSDFREGGKCDKNGCYTKESKAMKIPTGVCHRTFWEAAKSKGIKISSKFIGVYFNLNTNGSPSWMARVQAKGKWKFKRFEFTEKGETEASEFYKNNTR